MDENLILHSEDCLNIINTYANYGASTEKLSALYEIIYMNNPLIKEKESNKEKEINKKILSIISGKKERIRNITNDVRNYIEDTTGDISLAQMFSALSILTKEDKDLGRHVVKRLADQNVIRPTGKKAGIYIKIDHTENVIDWRTAKDEEYKIKFPLNIHQLVKIYPGNIVIVAGASNTGKTSFMLECIRLNQRERDTYYFNSEMGASELKTRIDLFHEVLPAEKWDFTAIERSSDFAEKIRPDALNIIDFMEVYDDFWKIGGWIRDIHTKLSKGVAIIAIQKKASTKKEQQDYARGGELTLEKPRLYLAMDRGKIKIVKAKAWRDHNMNPNGLIRNFSLISGWKFVPKGDWSSEEKQKYTDYGIKGDVFVHEA